MSGCLWSLLPFPIIIALYSIIRQPLSRFMLLSSDVMERVRAVAEGLGYAAEGAVGYEEIRLARFINDHFSAFSGIDGLIRVDYNFLGLDLTVTPGAAWKNALTGGWPAVGLVLIPVVSAALSLLQSLLVTAGSGQKDETAAKTNRTMFLLMPLMSLYIGFTLPAALGVYWIANSLFQIAQDAVLNRIFSRQMEREETERERRRREERVARLRAAQERQRQVQQQINRGEKPAAAKKPPEKRSVSTTEAGRVGGRPYARGRSYNPERYDDKE